MLTGVGEDKISAGLLDETLTMPLAHKALDELHADSPLGFRVCWDVTDGGVPMPLPSHKAFDHVRRALCSHCEYIQLLKQA